MRAFFYISALLAMGVVGVGGFILPDPAAVHFTGAGNVNGWMPRWQFLSFMTVMLLVLIVLFWGIRLLLPRIPVWMFNLPHKDYWFAPERREATFEIVRANIDRIGGATMLFMTAMLILSYVANLSQPPKLDSRLFWPVLIVYVVYVLGESLYSFWRFRLPRDE